MTYPLLEFAYAHHPLRFRFVHCIDGSTVTGMAIMCLRKVQASPVWTPHSHAMHTTLANQTPPKGARREEEGGGRREKEEEAPSQSK